MLTHSQRTRPHHTYRRSGKGTRRTHLEAAFASSHDYDRTFFWGNGVAETALAHPKRGPALIDAFISGLAHRGRLTDEERQTWERLWEGCPHRSNDSGLRAFGVLGARAPELARHILDEGLDPHRKGWARPHLREDRITTAWQLLVDEASRALRERPLDGDGEKTAATWQLIQSLEPGAAAAERHSALASLAGLYRTDHICPGSPPHSLREQLFANGADAWAGGTLMHVHGARYYPEEEEQKAQHQAWLLGFFRTPPTEAIKPSLDGLAGVSDPVQGLAHFASLGVMPWHSRLFPGSCDLKDSQRLERWMDAIARICTKEPPPATWLQEQTELWLDHSLRRLRQVNKPEETPIATAEGCASWERQWALIARMNGWNDFSGAQPPPRLIRRMTPALELCHKSGEAVRKALVATNTLGAFLVAASTAGDGWIVGPWRVLIQPAYRGWWEDAKATPQWDILRERLWQELVTMERWDLLGEGIAEEWAQHGSGLTPGQAAKTLSIAIAKGAQRVANHLMTDSTIAQANASSSFLIPWVEAGLGAQMPAQISGEQERSQHTLRLAVEAGIDLNHPEHPLIGAILGYNHPSTMIPEAKRKALIEKAIILGARVPGNALQSETLAITDFSSGFRAWLETQQLQHELPTPLKRARARL